MDPVFPTKKELLEKIQNLYDGTESREEVSDWAVQVINASHLHKSDELIWQILEGLGAADLPATDRDFLYTDEDFLGWKKELLNQTEQDAE